ncbi:type VI secretion system baseplate subunit TssK [Salmonella enterica subsp. enterica]|nr:type VI secretion system baseplate subunit TssK [Salmonella enterica subsp. enterica]
MSWNDRVVWSEGQFLLPQMFQQQERYLEHVMHYRSLPLTPFFWGFSHYNIDGEALNIGKLILKEASGIFPDGTPFNAPDHTPLPPPLTILPEHLNQQICLAVPVRAPNSEETTFDNNPESLARFSVHEHDIRDANSLGRGAQLLQLSHLRLRLLPEKAVTGAWIGLPLTRITGLNPDGRIDIDHDLIPPIINYQASSLMCTWLSWINDLIRMRADSLAERLTGSDNHGHEAAEVSDYLLLQILNRFEPLLTHLAKTPLAPEVLYRYLSELAGELSTYVRPQTRRPAEYKEYKHLTPYAGLKSLVDEVQFLLNAVLIRGAQRIELKEGSYGILNAVVAPSDLADFSTLVLAIKASMPTDVLLQHFAAQTKIGPSDRLPELIRSHLPGLALQVLPVPPRQIPFQAGYIYYDIRREGALWEHIARYGGMAMHTAGEFPGLETELWGVRGSRTDWRNRPSHDDSYGLSWGTSIGGGSLSLNWNQNRTLWRNGEHRKENITSLWFSMPLSRWTGNNVSASWQMTSPSHGGQTQQVGVNGEAFSQQLDWEVRQSYRADAPPGGGNNSALHLAWNGAYGLLGGDYSYSRAMRQMGVNIAGGIVIHHHGVTLGQPLQGSVALVEAPGASGVPVGGWPGVKTDFRGDTTVGNLSVYQENTVSLDPSRLPDDAEVTQTDVRVVPTEGAVVEAKFHTRIGARALMTLKREDGSAIPFGAQVTVNGQDGSAALVDTDSQVYLTGLADKGELTVKWGAQQCRVNYHLPAHKGIAGLYQMSDLCR